MFTISIFFLIGSNISFFVVSFIFLRRLMLLISFSFFLTGLSSVLYHTCRDGGLCLLNEKTLFFMDHTLATSVLHIFIIYFTYLLNNRGIVNEINLINLFITLFFNGIFILSRGDIDDFSIYQVLFIVLFAIFLVAFFVSTHIFFFNGTDKDFIRKFIYYFKKNDNKEYPWSSQFRISNIFFFSCGFFISIFIFVLFVVFNRNVSPLLFNWVHMFWHLLQPFGLCLMLTSVTDTLLEIVKKEDNFYSNYILDHF